MGAGALRRAGAAGLRRMRTSAGRRGPPGVSGGAGGVPRAAPFVLLLSFSAARAPVARSPSPAAAPRPARCARFRRAVPRAICPCGVRLSARARQDRSVAPLRRRAPRRPPKPAHGRRATASLWRRRACGCPWRVLGWNNAVGTRRTHEIPCSSAPVKAVVDSGARRGVSGQHLPRCHFRAPCAPRPAASSAGARLQVLTFDPRVLLASRKQHPGRSRVPPPPRSTASVHNSPLVPPAAPRC